MSDKNGAQLLLADLQHFGESLWRNEELGEKRFNFFLTFVTAVLAGVVAAHTSSELGADILTLLRKLASLSVLLLGGWTFLRMLKRDRVTDEHKATLRYLREILASRQSPPLRDYSVPYRPKQHPDRPSARRWRPSGGLAETVAVVNGLMFVLTMVSFGQEWGFSVMAGALVLGAQLAWASRRESGEVHPDQHFRAGVGAVILDPDGNVMGFPRKGAREWQLPQGGLLIGEDPETAVWRELEEETGLTGDDVELLRKHPRPLAYELPAESRSVKNGRGQIHFWFFFRAKRTELPRRVEDGGELGQPEWMSFDTLIERAVGFKRDVYQELRGVDA